MLLVILTVAPAFLGVGIVTGGFLFTVRPSLAWILIALGGLFLRLNVIVFGEPRGATAPAEASYVPMFTHLAIVLAAGIYLPSALVTGFQNVARLLG